MNRIKERRKLSRRLLSLLSASAMCFSMLPMSVTAEETPGPTGVTAELTGVINLAVSPPMMSDGHNLYTQDSDGNFTVLVGEDPTKQVPTGYLRVGLEWDHNPIAAEYELYADAVQSDGSTRSVTGPITSWPGMITTVGNKDQCTLDVRVIGTESQMRILKVANAFLASKFVNDSSAPMVYPEDVIGQVNKELQPLTGKEETVPQWNSSDPDYGAKERNKIYDPLDTAIFRLHDEAGNNDLPADQAKMNASEENALLESIATLADDGTGANKSALLADREELSVIVESVDKNYSPIGSSEPVIFEVVKDNLGKKFTNEKEKIAQIPEGKTLICDGTHQTGVEAGTGYTLSGQTYAVGVGEYQATATLNEDYKWSDGSAEPKTINWSIVPANLSQSEPVFPEGKDRDSYYTQEEAETIGLKIGEKVLSKETYTVSVTEKDEFIWSVKFGPVVKMSQGSKTIEVNKPCVHENTGRVYYNYSASTHAVHCQKCDMIIGFEDHVWESKTDGEGKAIAECKFCEARKNRILFLEGENQEVIKPTELQPFRIDADLGDLKEVKCGPVGKDGAEQLKTLTPGTDYDLKSGSTIITLTESYLNTLTAGEYKLVAYFENGVAFTTFTVKFLLGDVDGNMRTNMKDLAELQRYVNGWGNPINMINADLDGNNKLNMRDVAELQKLLNSQ